MPANYQRLMSLRSNDVPCAYTERDVIVLDHGQCRLAS